MLRPHMRIFYLSWMSGIMGFLGWYVIPPLMPVIKTQLGLTEGEVLNSDIASTASTIMHQAHFWTSLVLRLGRARCCGLVLFQLSVPP
ncbi:putative nitrate transporter [Phytophthora infestans]|uniref:Putative nitrate transporter n=1 Tax=Phytophthora infestans TaxID=4787 RepID=A0A833WB78_PHYIN|nr:putative nitrate transporter [Phytophthora infestans]